MASPVDFALVGVGFAVHTALAAVLTRFFRLRMRTRAGWVLYSLGGIPVVLLVSTLVFGGFLGIGPDLGSPLAVVALLIVLPLGVGFSVDVFWMPPPEEFDLPETAE